MLCARLLGESDVAGNATQGSLAQPSPHGSFLSRLSSTMLKATNPP